MKTCSWNWNSQIQQYEQLGNEDQFYMWIYKTNIENHDIDDELPKVR